jgi:hypothetical protein
VIRIAAALAIGLALSACGPTADSVSIHRFSAAAQNEFAPLDRTVTDPAVASRVYREIRALPQRSLQAFCPIDFGARHELSVYAGGERILHGVIQMSCHVLDLGAGDMRTFDEHFEAGLLDAFGLYTRGADLWPTPLPRP